MNEAPDASRLAPSERAARPSRPSRGGIAGCRRGVARLAKSGLARLPHALLAQAAAALLLASLGCRPTQPLYLGRTDDALSHYLDTATQIEYPDHLEPPASEAALARPPITLSNREIEEFWDLTLEDCVSISLQNSKILRNGSTPQVSVTTPLGQLARVPQGFSSVYDPAILESDPNVGVEAALSAFDAQFNSSFTYNTTDRPQNFGFFQPFLVQRQAAFVADVTKTNATGTQTYLRTTTDYVWSNNPAQSVPSAYTTALEMGVAQPLLRGAGTQINRAPVVIARLGVDQNLADFEASVRDHVLAVENSYWNLYQAYRVFETAKTSSESVLASWQTVNARYLAELEPDRTEAQARGQYFAFRALLEDSYRQLLNEENNLRLLMGLAPNDGRVIRPADIPPQAYFAFDWDAASAEALVRVPELRRTRWAIKQRELELIVARNQLLPNLNATALYRWVGVGDELIRSESSNARFPAPGSNAVEELLIGDFQEFAAGLEFNFPIGFRRELAGVRNAQLQLAREKARLEDQEIAVVQGLSVAFRNLDVQYQVLQTAYNQVLAADRELDSAKRYFEAELAPQGVRTTIDLVLDAERRRAEALRTFYTTQAEYARSIAAVHYAKGSILEYDNVALEEGPWPRKAYWDAWGHARRRSASHYLDYGWTRPDVVSQGPLPQGLGTTGPLPTDGPPPLGPTPAGRTNGAQPAPGAEPTPATDRPTSPGLTDPLADGRLRRLPSVNPGAVGYARSDAYATGGPGGRSVSPAATDSGWANVGPGATASRASATNATAGAVRTAGWRAESGGAVVPSASGSRIAEPPKKTAQRDTVSAGTPSRRWSRYLDDDPLPLRAGGVSETLLR